MSHDEPQLVFGAMVDIYPLDQPVVLCSGVACFADDCEKLRYADDDLMFLKNLPEVEVWYGAVNNRIYPFIAVPEQKMTEPPVARRVLELLRGSCFESEHIKSLDVVNVPFPGYHPRTKNDEIHSNPLEQCLFATDKEDLSEEDESSDNTNWKALAEESQGCHERLRSAVLDNHLYYIQIHTKRKRYDGAEIREYVIVFAVGVSRASGNLIGMVSCQLCHNLCD